MTHTAPHSRPRTPESPWASGGTLFAGVLMVVTGVVDILQGIAGIAHNTLYARVDDYVYRFNLTAWGWIHLCLGALVALTGYAILRGTAWGRYLGIILAGLNIVAHFLFLPYQPWWSLFSMAVTVFVIWALTVDVTYRDHRT